MTMYFDGVTTTVHSSGYLDKNLEDVQIAITNVMRTYNGNHPITKPAIAYVRYDSEVPEIKICMSDDTEFCLPFYGITARELWNSGEKVISYLELEMGVKSDDVE